MLNGLQWVSLRYLLLRRCGDSRKENPERYTRLEVALILLLTESGPCFSFSFQDDLNDGSL